MKINFSGWTVIIILILFFSACKKRVVNVTSLQSVMLGNCMERTTVPYICFDSLITDSRCPIGGICIWQGTALIKISFRESGYVHKFTMSLKGFPGIGYPSDTAIGGYKISFTDLKPYPDTNTPTRQKLKPEAFFSITH
ncbi:MAG: hypothetical protein JST63_07920 [Bacteroidetes bacterium]|nr:hypothetical protein [Bacteroidota bacterium]